jgi:putative transposase
LLHLSKIGDIPIRVHRQVEEKVKQITIKRHSSGKWFACISVEVEEEISVNNVNNVIQREKRVIGIDVGVKHLLTDSNGRQIENPKFYEQSLQRIRIEHKKLSRKKKGSRNREKQRIRLARAYEKIVNQRDDFLHKLARFYANNYDVICVENLNIRDMVKAGNHNLAKKILDASWSKFLHMLEFKAERAGTLVVKVNPRGTSQEYKHGKIDRDYNASLNILERGLSVSGLGRSFEPAEMEPLLAIPASSIVEAGSPQPFRGG